MTRTMVLGIGAPKAGTTWLHAYLAGMPGFAGGFTKEYHIWDAVFLPECSRFKVSEGRPILSAGHLLRREMQKYPEAYFGYFAALLDQPGARICADITPSYCGLGGEQLRFIHAGLVARGLEVKVVLSLRDPVERCWSMIRMFRANPAMHRHEGLDFSKPDDALLRDYALTGNARVRTRYDLTLAAIRNSGIPASSIHIGLYEEMFEPAPFAALCAFLGVPERPELIERRVNASPKSQTISDETRAFVARLYAGAYLATERVLPQARGLWSGFAHLGDGKVAA